MQDWPSAPSSIRFRRRCRELRAVEHGAEHVIKLADTAADVYARTGNTDVLAAGRAVPAFCAAAGAIVGGLLPEAPASLPAAGGVSRVPTNVDPPGRRAGSQNRTI